MPTTPTKVGPLFRSTQAKPHENNRPRESLRVPWNAHSRRGIGRGNDDGRGGERLLHDRRAAAVAGRTDGRERAGAQGAGGLLWQRLLAAQTRQESAGSSVLRKSTGAVDPVSPGPHSTSAILGCRELGCVAGRSKDAHRVSLQRAAAGSLEELHGGRQTR